MDGLDFACRTWLREHGMNTCFGTGISTVLMGFVGGSFGLEAGNSTIPVALLTYFNPCKKT
jgi:hypothetical protein